MLKRRLPAVFYNPISLVGAGIAVFNIGFIIFLLVVEAFSRRAHPYADLIVWIVLPAFVLAGVALLLFGIWRERRRERQGIPAGERRFAILDINDPRHRAAAIFVLGGLTLLTMLYGFAGYKAYEWSESTAFCGTMCHAVMGPEHRAHSRSAHAQVDCAACHVGPGAKEFVLAKLRGTRQLIHLVADSYPRPIPTPVHDLRPSQEVCENCHGPKLEVHRRLESRNYFLSDEKNTPKTIHLLFRMGATAADAQQRPAKMHWHSSTTQEIVFAASDEKRATIPWIRVKRLDGKERTYRLADQKMSDAEANAAGLRKMDCTDCHNRAGHPFRPARELVNALLATKLVDPTLPEIKRLAVETLEAEYKTRDEALQGIDKSIREHYQKSGTASSKEASVAAAIRAVQLAYANNYDPAMKVTWKNFPNNQGHMSSPGCFRCHDGKHRSDDGAVLPSDCSTCHLLIGRVDEPRGSKTDRALFELLKNPHPADVGDAWKQAPCHSCHGG